MRLRALLPPILLAFAAFACGDESGGGYAESVQETPVSATDAAPAPLSDADGGDNAARPPATGLEQGRAVGLEAGVQADTVTGAAAQDPAGAEQAPAPTIPTMIIRNGTAEVEVESLEPAIARVRQLAQRLGGYVGNTTVQTGRQQARSATLELKIPSARFEQALTGLEPVGKVQTVQSTAQDVGEEFVDVTARMTNARRLEQRLVELLANRTGRLEDVLQVERELARVREEIERYQGRLRYLRTRAAISTLTVTLHEPYPVVGDYPGQNPILRAFTQAWRNFVNFTALLIASLGVLIPLALLLWLAIWVIVKLLRKFFSRADIGRTWAEGPGGRGGQGGPGSPPHAPPPPPPASTPPPPPPPTSSEAPRT